MAKTQTKQRSFKRLTIQERDLIEIRYCIDKRKVSTIANELKRPLVQPPNLRRPTYQLLRDSLIDNWPRTRLVVGIPAKNEVVCYYTPRYTFG